MAEFDRNVWDPPTPAGATELGLAGKVVDLYIYIFADSSRVDQTDAETLPGVKTAKADVQAAAEIWRQENSQINIQAVHLDRLPPFPPTEPADLSSRNLAAEIDCPLTDEIREQFFALSRRGDPDLSKSLVVYYIPGTNFLSGGTGCHSYFHSGAADVDPLHLIILTDDADGRVLAHEIGHALLTRTVVAPTWTNDDPDPDSDPASPAHNLNDTNLMFPVISNPNPVISRPQGEVTRESVLTHDRHLVSGWIGQTLDLGVRFNALTVHGSSDEITSDDQLESSWTFNARTVSADGTVERSTDSVTWSRDPLEWRTHQLDAGPESFRELLPLRIAAATDKLVINVSGVDDDFGPNDTLPSVHEDLLKGADSWRTGSTNIPGGQPGEQLAHRNSDDIDYSLKYTIRVASPPVQVTFRTIV